MTELKGLHILIAEDDPDDAEFILNSFRKHASFTRFDWVMNGKELLHFLSDENQTQPDIILTDINMPIINGIEALEIIFQNKSLSQIPCFVYTSAANPMYETQCKDLGVKAFLIKPFSLSDFDEIPYQITYLLNREMES